MTPAVRRSALALVFAFLPIAALAAEPWEGAPFTSDPKALLAAAEAVPAGESGLVVLLDEAAHTFDDKGGSVMTQRLLYRIVDESAIDSWGSINAPWAPWYQERPELRARVVTKDGTVHELDKNAIIEAPTPEESLDIFSDNRIIRAPLPAVAVGSVVEQLITYKSKDSLYNGASSDLFFFGNYYPVHRARLVVDAPEGLPLHFINQSRIEPKKTVAGGRQRVVYEGGPFTPNENMEFDLPFDVAPLPWVGVSTASSWGELARRYNEIVDKQIGTAKVAGPTLKGDRKEIVAQALAWIQSRVRYAGVEVGESSVVPRPPQTVLSNRYGDCKDKATLLVALLRQAGIEAHVALLRAGEDFDVPKDLPGLGMFNHAIVVVGDGADQIWVDPTDEFARAGELPLMDQGRQALIASAKTTSLTTTPLSESTANRIVEHRTFNLPEEGKAALVEITEPAGADEAFMRRYWVSSDRKRYRESMEEYVRNYYGAKSLSKMEASDAHDLSKPFRIELAITDAARGQSVDGEAAVAIFPANLLQNLPWSLRPRDRDQEQDDDANIKRIRRNDFFFTRPFQREWRYRIVPPAGYVARTLPQNETVKIGTMSMTREYTAGADGVVTAVFRMDSGKRRLTAVEVEETKKALAEHGRMPMVLIGFDQRGMLELNNGNITAALSEFRKLATAHPKEGRHQVEIARALLLGGMGEAAREQIKKAIALEPAYARAHRMLGLILQHDLLGRPYRKGFDLAGAIAAFRKAKQLDPKDEDIRAGLARLLEMGEDGLRFGRGAKIDEAVIEWRSLIEDGEKQYRPDLHLALARSARWSELRSSAKDAEDVIQRNLWNVVATAATDGSKAAVREAAAVDQAQRKDILRTAGGIILAMRMYDRAADLLEEAMQGSPTAESRQQVEGLRKAKRIEDMPLPKDDPKSIARQFAVESILSEMTPELVAKFYTADEREFFTSERLRAQWRQTRLNLLSVAQKQALPLEFYADVGMGTLQVVQDGDDETGYRIRMRSTSSRQREETFYVVKENGEYRISATNDSNALIGFSVLRLLDANKPEAARQWLNWAREELSAGSEDPFASSPFARHWPKAKQSATVEEMRLAAALLMPSKELGAHALKILLPAREKAANDEERTRIDHAIALTWILQEEETAKLVELTQRLAASAPDSGVMFNMLTAALSNLDRNDEVIKLANERLARMPKDDDAIRALGQASMHKGDYASSDKYYRQVVDELRPTSGDYNNMAWNALLSGKDLEKALEDARLAMQSGGGSALLHTLASLYAETGKSLEAREALLKSMDDAGRDEPAPHDWYVLGRIAENYGATDAAVAAYKRVDKPKESVASSTWVLAERRMKAIGRR
jgi:tetratricopeptide (TPR) repeat protein/transglutaminase-like putative cysteine protease